jgi:hypothetical protein
MTGGRIVGEPRLKTSRPPRSRPASDGDRRPDSHVVKAQVRPASVHDHPRPRPRRRVEYSRPRRAGEAPRAFSTIGGSGVTGPRRCTFASPLGSGDAFFQPAGRRCGHSRADLTFALRAITAPRRSQLHGLIGHGARIGLGQHPSRQRLPGLGDEVVRPGPGICGDFPAALQRLVDPSLVAPCRGSPSQMTPNRMPPAWTRVARACNSGCQPGVAPAGSAWTNTGASPVF